MSEALRSREVIVGVDTHKHVHAAVAINELSARLGATTIPVGAKGLSPSLSTYAAYNFEGRDFPLEEGWNFGITMNIPLFDAVRHMRLKINSIKSNNIFSSK